jgi:hypothetical protein
MTRMIIFKKVIFVIILLSMSFGIESGYCKTDDSSVSNADNNEYAHIVSSGINFRAVIGYGLMKGSLSSDYGTYEFNGNSYLLDLSLGYAVNNCIIPYIDLRFSMCPATTINFNGKTYTDKEMRLAYDTTSIGAGLRSYVFNTNLFVSEAIYIHTAFYDGENIYCATKYGLGVGLNIGYDFRIGSNSGIGVILSYYGSRSEMDNEIAREKANNGNKYHKAVGHELVLGLTYVYF